MSVETVSNRQSRGTLEPISPYGIRPLQEREFRAFQQLIEAQAGIHLSDAKKALLVGRLSKRLRELHLDSFSAYFEQVQRSPEELVLMLDCICTNETHFFREMSQFDLLERQILPAWVQQAEAGQRPRRLRIWSAACSTGEEPYSLAMLLLSCLPAGEWDLQIVATDLSTKVLRRAQEAIWPLQKSAEIPSPFLKRFMLKGTGSQTGRMRAGPEIRALVHFQRANLTEEPLAVNGPFDLIFCRNVLIYFPLAVRTRVTRSLFSRLAPDGYVFLGHAETLTGIGEPVRCLAPNIYAHAANDQARRAR